jgi:putative SOS response-associated peptidase YedK
VNLLRHLRSVSHLDAASIGHNESVCGRFASFTRADDLADLLRLAETSREAAELAPSWNVAPTDPVRIAVERPTPNGEIVRQLQVARWGLVPPWAKDPKSVPLMFNARAETIATKPAFAKAFAARRCLVPADGYFEWQTITEPGAKPAKQPYWITPKSGPLVFAGLYEFWRDRDRADGDPARWLVSTTIITTAASAQMAPIHERMPVALAPDTWDEWLNPAVGADQALHLLSRPPATFTLRPLSGPVGRAAIEALGDR